MAHRISELVRTPDTADDARAVHAAMGALAAGRPVVVVDEHGAGDLVLAADRATTAALAFLVRHGSGLVYVALTGDACDRLRLPPMTFGRDAHGSAQRVAVDAAAGASTGISAADRGLTVRLLADPGTVAADLVRPGHVIPLRAHDGGVVARAGCPEAAVELARLAGRAPAAALCTVVSTSDPCRMAGPVELRDFATEHDLELIEVARLALHVAGPRRIDRAAG